VAIIVSHQRVVYADAQKTVITMMTPVPSDTLKAGSGFGRRQRITNFGESYVLFVYFSV
jgi:hypothetical protein